MRRHAVNVGKTLAAFAKQECRDFAVAFHAAVPREIRDMVYDLLVDKTSILIEDDEPIPPWTYADTQEHWLSSEFVVPYFARECAERHYEVAPYTFSLGGYKMIPEYPTPRHIRSRYRSSRSHPLLRRPVRPIWRLSRLGDF
jgi:hypothetical protein